MHDKGLRARLMVLAMSPPLALLGGKAALAGMRTPRGVQLRSCILAACCTLCFMTVLPAAIHEPFWSFAICLSVNVQNSTSVN